MKLVLSFFLSEFILIILHNTNTELTKIMGKNIKMSQTIMSTYVKTFLLVWSVFIIQGPIIIGPMMGEVSLET